ncbi:MAG: DNA recombination protein RmuC [Lentimicrobiaceae bacterium]|nr:DNA recombination protein RmuC [Lentimicrobiaceae bacterium]
MDILFVVIGLLGVGVALYMGVNGQKNTQKLQSLNRQQSENLIQVTAAKEALDSKLSGLSDELQQYKTKLDEKTFEVQEKAASAAQLRAVNANLQEKLDLQKTEIQEIREQLYKDFKLTAEAILEEKTKKFSEVNEEKLGNVLNPLKEKIQAFEKKVEETYHNETREKESLRKELEQLLRLNKQVSDDAQRLALALKGDSKTQGDWGEIQLELLLEKTGLVEDIHFHKQINYKTEEGNNVRPDFVINLPDSKNFIIDSKVSLTAYENYYNEENEDQKAVYLKEHLNSLGRHIMDLSSKNYQQLYGINSPDYVFLYVALEPALTLALQKDPSLFEKALNKNVVLVSGSTLLASMRTVSFIWKQENQKNNVMEIAKESGMLYDKFVAFTEDLIKLGNQLNTTQETYKISMNKLTESTRKGDTIVGKIEKIRQLGANAAKQIDRRLLDKAQANDERIMLLEE